MVFHLFLLIIFTSVFLMKFYTLFKKGYFFYACGVLIIFLYFGINNTLYLLDPELASSRYSFFDINYNDLSLSLVCGLIIYFGLFLGFLIFPKKLKKSFFINYKITRIKIIQIISVIHIFFIYIKTNSNVRHYAGELTPKEKQFDLINKLYSDFGLLFQVNCFLFLFLFFTRKTNSFSNILLFVNFIFLIYSQIISGGIIGVFLLIVPFIIFYFTSYKKYFLNMLNQKISFFKLIIIFMLSGISLLYIKELVRSYIRDPLNFEFLTAFLSINKKILILGGNLFPGIDIIFVCNYYVNKFGYLFGETYLNLFIWWIPSYIFKNKPEITSTVWFHDNVWRSNAELYLIDYQTGLQGNNMLYFGEGYLNFGLLGVFLSSFIIGISYGFFEKKFREKFSPIIFVYFSLIFFNIVHPSTTLAAHIAILVKIFLVVFIYKKIIGYKEY